MAVSNILNVLSGYRLFDGTLLNQIISNVNSLTTGGTSRALTAKTLSMTVTATANSDFTLPIPSGAIIRSMSVYTTTAFTAVTDAQISVGSAAGGAQYVALTSIKAVGIVSLTLVAAAAATFLNFTAGTLFVRIVQTGGSTAVGAATLSVTYEIPTT